MLFLLLGDYKSPSFNRSNLFFTADCKSAGTPSGIHTSPGCCHGFFVVLALRPVRAKALKIIEEDALAIKNLRNIEIKEKNIPKYLVDSQKSITFALANEKWQCWFRSSVGLEQQPSKLWVLGSNPNGITKVD